MRAEGAVHTSTCVQGWPRTTVRDRASVPMQSINHLSCINDAAPIEAVARFDQLPGVLPRRRRHSADLEPRPRPASGSEQEEQKRPDASRHQMNEVHGVDTMRKAARESRFPLLGIAVR